MEINTKYEMGQKVYRARVIKRTFDIEETVKKAYPNYFVDITDFLNKIKKLYKELETIRQNHKTG